MYMSHDRSCVSHDRPTDRVAGATWRAGASTLKSPRRVSRSGHVSNSNKHQVSTVHKSRGGGGATDRPTSHAAATDAPPTPTPTLDVDSTDVDRAYIFFSRPARVSRSRSRRRERRARTPVGRTDRILARGGGRGRSRGRIVDAADDATRAWGRKRAWEVKRKRPRAVAETRGRKTRGRRRRRGRERATDRRRGRRSNSCDES